ncbi:MAG: hypothetical protein AB7I30_17175 [Isosphaeraceae bacterium]
MRPSLPRLHASGLATRTTWTFALTLTTWLLAGCGGEPGMTRVNGRVTYKGEPVPSGTVYFSPDEPGQRGAQGPLDSNGYYSLGTFQPGDGAYVGKHKVSIVAQGPDKPIPAKMKGKMMEEDMQGTGDPLIPRKYFSAEQSGLEAEVTDRGPNTFNFELTD